VLGSIGETGVLGFGNEGEADFGIEDGGEIEIFIRDDEAGGSERVGNGNDELAVEEPGKEEDRVGWDEDFAADAVTATVEEGLTDSTVAIEVAILDVGLLQGRLMRIINSS
jgi:hypothetical protein